MELYSTLVESKHGNAWIAQCGKQEENKAAIYYTSDMPVKIDIVIKNNIVFCIDISANVN